MSERDSELRRVLEASKKTVRYKWTKFWLLAIDWFYSCVPRKQEDRHE